MTLTRAVPILTAVALLSVCMAVSVSATDAEPDPGAVSVVWDDRPDSVAELADDTTALVEADVVAVEDGPDLTSDFPGDDPAEHAIPTQRISFHTVHVLDGGMPPTFKLFKTGSVDTHLQGDPAYATGERYVLFLRPYGEPGTYVPAAPDGRIGLDSMGEADPVIGGPVSQELDGLTPEEIAEEASQ
jgi:hypothetical protein